MSKSNTSHPERTSTEPRQNSIHRAKICYVRNVNPRIRLLRLALPYAVQFLPGQWLDVHIPSLPNHTGGFTITSAPIEASENLQRDPVPPKQRNQKLINAPRPYVELAVQNAPKNPSATWLWEPQQEILDQDVHIRVGGSFVWPPPVKNIHTAVFVAGGVGINPMMSMLSHLASRSQQEIPKTIKLLYSTSLRDGTHLEEVLFFGRLVRVFEQLNRGSSTANRFDLHITDKSDVLQENTPSWLTIRNGRITKQQLTSATESSSGPRDGVVSYVCGPPAMTDELVDILKTQDGMKDNVFCEKWW